MPAKDTYHDVVKNALVKDGWTITDDPFHLKWGAKDMYVDLGAERILGAEKGQTKIAVEIKSFMGPSEMDDLEKAVGQFVLYGDVLAQVEPDRELFLAVDEKTYVDLFEEPIGKLLLEKQRVRLVIFEAKAEVIRQWNP